MMTQKELILDYMRTHNGITSREAFVHLGITRLSARIHDLRGEGYQIINQRCEAPTRHGKTAHFDRYKVVE